MNEHDDDPPEDGSEPPDDVEPSSVPGVRTGGALGGYRWGLEVKRALLGHEAGDAGDAEAAIAASFRRDAVLEADGLSVETFSGGLVILSGTVRSWVAHDHAVAAPCHAVTAKITMTRV